jgi:DNA-directed RNA polymerase specialized sigma24 family protein
MALEDPDLALVQALRAGEDRALNSLIERHREGLYRFVFRHVPNEDEAIELTQKAFVRAYLNIKKFRPTAKFVTWLYHIALNLCRDYARSPAYRYLSQTISTDVSVEENEGELLGISPKAVEMKVYRARKLLLKKMGEMGF